MDNSLPHSLGELYKHLKLLLAQVSDVPALEARRMINHRCGIDWSDIAAFPEKFIEEDDLNKLEADIQARLNGKPLSKIYGVKEFWGLEFIVSEDVLDPRPDTETIVDIAVRKLGSKSGQRIIDLGTGSGCLIISLLKEFPDSHGWAVDKSEAALEIARQNAEKHGVAERLTFIQSDWWHEIGEGESFDLVVSNPPYIRASVIPELDTEVKNFDPILALDGGADGLQAYKIIFSKLFSHLKKGGLGLFEIGFDQADDVMRLGIETGLDVKMVHPDLAGQPRVVEISSGDK